MGIAIIAILRPFKFRWRRGDRELWRYMKSATVDSSMFKTPFARETLEELRGENPELAGQMMNTMRQIEELETQSNDPGKHARQFARIVDVAGYLAVGLLVLGVAAVVGGTACLGTTTPRLSRHSRRFL